MLNTPSTKSSTEAGPSKAGRIVIRLGGSLLDLDDVVDRMLTSLHDVSLPLVIVGGGSAADQVRQWDADGLLDDSEAHQLAIAAMSFNAQKLAESDDRLKFTSSLPDAISAASRGQLPVLDVFAVLLAEERRNTPLPRIPPSWDVTSDSIAAWLARAWQADLRLCKSVDPQSWTRDVDRWFFTAAAGLSQFQWVNLRSQPNVVVDLTLAPEVADSSSGSRGHH